MAPVDSDTRPLLLTHSKFYLWSTQLADRGLNKLEKKHVKLTKDGVKVEVKGVSEEEYAARQQEYVQKQP